MTGEFKIEIVHGRDDTYYLMHSDENKSFFTVVPPCSHGKKIPHIVDYYNCNDLLMEDSNLPEHFRNQQIPRICVPTISTEYSDTWFIGTNVLKMIRDADTIDMRKFETLYCCQYRTLWMPHVYRIANCVHYNCPHHPYARKFSHHPFYEHVNILLLEWLVGISPYKIEN